ncbi:MAG TPA: N-formylglutamate amidohydrolase, partial [Caulobacteraceae bacterium]|nr:N-formylglutamate amidohydrolase [Caulobacteraceae bacterium]
MNAWEPIAPILDGAAGADDPAEACAPYALTRPAPDVRARPLIFASPHSGRVYPAAMMAATRLPPLAIRRSEDAWVDRLIEAGPAHGATLLAAQLARVWFDVNREPWELDPAMFEGELPAYARGRSARVAAGLGAIARIVSEGEEIYDRKLSFAEARDRVEGVHRPYHDALASLI